MAFELLNAYPGLARNGVAEYLRTEINSLAQSAPTTTRGRGYNMGAPALLSRILAHAGVCSASVARERIKLVRRRAK